MCGCAGSPSHHKGHGSLCLQRVKSKSDSEGMNKSRSRSKNRGRAWEPGEKRK